jgi:hypothetical protein
MEQVCLIISSALNTLSELLILKLDKNLIERVLEFYRFSLDVRGMCEKVELVCQYISDSVSSSFRTFFDDLLPTAAVPVPVPIPVKTTHTHHTKYFMIEMMIEKHCTYSIVALVLKHFL